MANETILHRAEGLRALAPQLIGFVEETRSDLQAGLGARGLNGLEGALGGFQDESAPGLLDVAEQAMLDRVPLGGVGRIVGNAQAQPHALGEGDQVFFETQRPGGIGAATVQQQEQFGGVRVERREVRLPGQGDGVTDEGAGLARGAQGDEGLVEAHVVDAVRDEPPGGQVAEIMVVDHLRCGAVTATTAVQAPEEFLLFGVDTEHGRALHPRQAAQGGDVAELCIALHWIDDAGDQFLAQRARPKPPVLEPGGRRVATDSDPVLEQCLCETHRIEIRPPHPGIGRLMPRTRAT